MWSIGAVVLAMAGAGLAAGGQLWGLWLLLAGGLCGARAERNHRDQEIALALVLWLVLLLVVSAAGIAAWNAVRGWLA